MTGREKLMDKIRKLLEHAASAEKIGSLEEAATFAAKADQLLTEHKLSRAEVEIFGTQCSTDAGWEDEPIDREYVDIQVGRKKKTGYNLWQAQLASVVAELCFCEHLAVPSSPKQIFIGRAQDRAVAAYLYEVLAKECHRMGWKEYAKARKRDEYTRNFFRSFCTGFVHAINTRVAEQRKTDREQFKQLHGETASKNALVVLQKERDSVREWMEQNMSWTSGPRRRSNSRNAAGYYAGKDAGSRASLSGRGVGGRSGASGSKLLK